MAAFTVLLGDQCHWRVPLMCCTGVLAKICVNIHSNGGRDPAKITLYYNTVAK